ncbi:transmembrane protein, putative (macronuclear) [Tetrahymena thermophila SB210]|uniref:Transmembrane protein, putative n=1 Tax=Tetrahymena thermophila (strain SB210) TaxID=312017 RepID=W7XES2_TETTS|nr:transmembrane protein, putative [Tetrahymena thermophila SB210]EWS72416.1 transmembrane protein, putative [Tetrahymena thermophila SB210]|eukprot:XP_012655043.1 transmembrane protein, putative [Tetrahymena thermophila SB210]
MIILKIRIQCTNKLHANAIDQNQRIKFIHLLIKVFSLFDIKKPISQQIDQSQDEAHTLKLALQNYINYKNQAEYWLTNMIRFSIKIMLIVCCVIVIAIANKQIFKYKKNIFQYSYYQQLINYL